MQHQHHTNMTLPPPIYTMERVASVTGRDGSEFAMVIGLDEGLIAQLKEYSLDMSDRLLQRGTSDFRRFGQGSYEKWYKKGRTPFALIDARGVLAALIWFGPAPLPPYAGEASGSGSEGEWETIAFRSYGPYRGAGLMSSFGGTVLSIFDQHRPEKKLWLETNADNEAGAALYKKLGFVPQGLAQSGRTVMTRG